MKNKTIKNSNLPAKLPVGSSILYYIALDYYKAPEWLWTVAIIIFSLFWIGGVVKYFTHESWDITELAKERTKK
jgi:hypothetical protein